MRRADLAMYEAKRRGRDQVVRYAREPAVAAAVPGPTGEPAGQSQWKPRTDLPRTATGREVATGNWPLAAAPPADGPPAHRVRTPAPVGARAAPVAIDVPPESPCPAPWERR